MIQIEKIKNKIKELRISNPYSATASQKLTELLSFIESLEQEPSGKTNPLFEECVVKVDTAIMREVSKNVDKMLEQEPSLPSGLDEVMENQFDDVFDEMGRENTTDIDSPFDLFLVTPDKELTEFESSVIDNMIHLDNGEYNEIGVSNFDSIKEWAKDFAHKLMELARKELRKESCLRDHFMLKNATDNAERESQLKNAFEEGGAEALKNLPRWKKITRPVLDYPYVEFDPSSGTHTLFDGKYAITLKDLRKLSKED